MARLTTMGELAASIAHEVNQPLAAIVANGNACLRWLRRAEPDLDEAQTAVERIVRDGRRAGDIISRIRALSKQTSTEKESLDVNGIIQEVVALVQAEVRRNRVALRTELADDLPRVLGDRVQLQQVLLNLMMNGIEAMRRVEDRPRELVIRTQKGDESQVSVAVQDSGMGLESANMDRIFDAFYTTKREGMGMGLSISRSIVENHGGRLRAAANKGPGATFEFTLAEHS
jgi:signal transduction histidine kinase